MGAEKRRFMSILVNKSTRVIVQGLTGREGTFHAKACAEYGTQIVGGVTPGKGGTTHEGWPIFNTVQEAVDKTARGCFGDLCSATVCRGRDHGSCRRRDGTDRLHHRRHSDARHGSRLGVPAEPPLAADRSQLSRASFRRATARLESCPPASTRKGRWESSRAPGTLTYEAVYQLTTRGIGQSTAIGIGGDPIIGTNFLDALELFNRDPQTEAVMMIGEIGGNAEETAAEYVKMHMKKPVVGFIAGQTAPPGRRMGHAGAIISGGKGTAAEKIKAMEAAGIRVAKSPAEIGETVAAAMGVKV